MISNYYQVNSPDGTKITYDRYLDPESPQTLVFLHGFGGDLTAWNHERDMLNKHRISSVALDLRGHGFSDRSDDYDFYDFKNFTNDVIAVIEAEKIVNPILVGHCFGGMISILMEHYHPEVSRGLVLVDTNYKPPYFAEKFVHIPLAHQLLRLLAKVAPSIRAHEHVNFDHFVGTSDLDIRRIYSDIEHTSLRTYLMIIEHLIEYNATKFINEIRKPTLIIEGEEDKVFPPYIARDLNQRIHESKLVVIPQANHIIVVNNPEEIVNEILTFVDIL